MSIQYSGNTAIYSTTTGSSNPALDLENFLLTSLVAAGWTLTQTAASTVLSFTSQPANTSTFTVDSSTAAETYTFVSALTSSNQIVIGVNLAATLSNALNALTGGAGSGTTYSSSFTRPPNMTVTGNSTSLTFTYTTLGSAGNGAASSTSGTINATFTGSSLAGGSNIFVSAITPQGLAMRVQEYLTAGNFYNPGTGITLIPGTRDGVRVPSSAAGYMIANSVPTASTTYKMIASKYQLFIFVPGTTASTTIGNGVACGVPFITSNLVAPTISAATNANPIVCTITNHGFANGDSVLIVGGTGNTAMNGLWTITKIDANTFSIPTSGNGTYNANSAYCSDTTLGNTICEAIWSGQSAGGGPPNFRNQAYLCPEAFWDVNGSTVSGDNSAARIQIVTPSSIDGAQNTDLQWYDNTFLLSEPFMAWGVSSGATAKIIGQIWDAAMVRTALTIDQTASFDNPSHTFWTVGSANHNSMMWATTA